MDTFSSPFFIYLALGTVLICGTKGRVRVWTLIGLSYLFYLQWTIWATLLMFISTTSGFFWSTLLKKSQNVRNKKIYLSVTIIIDLSILIYFKQQDFFLNELNRISNIFSSITWIKNLLPIAIPAGLSYYTFKSISHSINTYIGKERAKTFLDYAAYISFFPQITAGPIERYENFEKNLYDPVGDRQRFTAGFLLIVSGFWKKFFIAGNVHYLLIDILNGGDPITSTSLFILYANYLEVYADFSGYTDIARGAAYFLGFETIANFKQPLFATRPSEIWKRWHISLSRWVQDYVFIFFASIRKKMTRLDMNLAAIFSMVVIGLWHEITWGYLLWGLFHGSLLIIEPVLFGKKKKQEDKIFFKRLATLHLMGLSTLVVLPHMHHVEVSKVLYGFTAWGWSDGVATSYFWLAIFWVTVILRDLFDEQTGGPDTLAKSQLSRKTLLIWIAMLVITLFAGTPGAGTLYAGF